MNSWENYLEDPIELGFNMVDQSDSHSEGGGKGLAHNNV